MLKKRISWIIFAVLGLVFFLPSLVQAEEGGIIEHTACAQITYAVGTGCYIERPVAFVMIGRGYAISTIVFQGKAEFTLKNISRRRINLNNGTPFVIKDAFGKVVFKPESAQSVLSLKKGESVSWSWNGTNRRGGKVPSGTYQFRIPNLNGALVEFPWR